MNFKFSTLAITAATLMFFSACSNTTNNLPKNPKDKEEYRDNSGNLWLWNAALGCWMMNGLNNGNTNSYRYYPDKDQFTNSRGVIVVPPSNIGNSIQSASYTSKSPTSHSSTKGGVFGSTGKGTSVSA